LRRSPDRRFTLPRNSETSRLFFALWPDTAVRDRMYTVAQMMHANCGGRVTRRDNLHLTLVFLGDVAREKIPVLEALAANIRGESPGLRFGLSAYWRHNRIVYAAPHEVPDALPALVAAIEKSLSDAQIAFDWRPYVPHITLIRNARTPAALPLLEFEWAVSDFALVESARDATGPAYRVRARWPLIP
jgi:RNA 2',3'-cyclic 3'-phosphodiesterase